MDKRRADRLIDASALARRVSIAKPDAGSMDFKKIGMHLPWNSCEYAYDLLCCRKIEALEARVKELLADRAASADTSQVSSERWCSSRSTSIADDENGGKDVVDRGFLSVEMARTYVEAFRAMMTPHFPFVVIPPNLSVHQLRQGRPFLFLAIIATASYKNMPLQRSLGAEVKRAVSSRMILNGEVSFDLLQGLLVFLAW